MLSRIGLGGLRPGRQGGGDAGLEVGDPAGRRALRRIRGLDVGHRAAALPPRAARLPEVLDRGVGVRYLLPAARPEAELAVDAEQDSRIRCDRVRDVADGLLRHELSDLPVPAAPEYDH
jgi:hypothetical protein